MQLPCPVIVVPGITASSLRDEYPVDPERIWNLVSASSTSLPAWQHHLDRLALHPSDLRFEQQQPARIVPDALFGLPYADLVAELRHTLSQLADQPVPVFPFAYDWRRPLDDTERQLAAFIPEVIERTRLLPHYHASDYHTSRFPGRVNLVAHSMGGLVVAGYLARHGTDHVDKVASLGSPFRGSHEAVLKIATGLASIGLSAANARERETARLTPSLYHLIPDFPGAIVTRGPFARSLFEVDSWQPSILATLGEHVRLHGLPPANPSPNARTLLQQLLATARCHRQRLESLTLPNPKSWLCLVGVGNRTRTRLRIESRSGYPFFNLTGVDRENDWTPTGRKTNRTGDGTVPYLGARCAFIPPSQVVCLCPDDLGYWELEDRLFLSAAGLHPVLPKINLAQRLIATHLLGQPQGSLWGRRGPDLPNSEAWDPPIPGLTEKDAPVKTTRPRRTRH